MCVCVDHCGTELNVLYIRPIISAVNLRLMVSDVEAILSLSKYGYLIVVPRHLYSSFV